MLKSRADSVQVRVFGRFGLPNCAIEIAIGDGIENLVQRPGIRVPAEVSPPQYSLGDDGQGDQECEQDWPHDRAAFIKEIEHDVGEQELHSGFV